MIFLSVNFFWAALWILKDYAEDNFINYVPGILFTRFYCFLGTKLIEWFKLTTNKVTDTSLKPVDVADVRRTVYEDCPLTIDQVLALEDALHFDLVLDIMSIGVGQDGRPIAGHILPGLGPNLQDCRTNKLCHVILLSTFERVLNIGVA